MTTQYLGSTKCGGNIWRKVVAKFVKPIHNWCTIN